MLEAEETAVFCPQISNYTDASLILQTHLTQILKGEVSQESGMKVAAVETRVLLTSQD
jgi:hypothetical protein